MARNIRIELEAASLGKLKDLYTETEPQLIRGNDYALQLCLFSNGVMLQRADTSTVVAKIFESGGTLRHTFNASTGNLNSSITPAQWRNGSAHFLAISLSDTLTASLTAGRYRMTVTANLSDGSAVLYGDGYFDLASNPSVTTPASPPTPPEDYYTQAECDAAFAAKSYESTVDDAVETLDDLRTYVGYPGDGSIGALVKYDAPQSLSDTEKGYVRSSIGAAAADNQQTAILTSGSPTFTPLPIVNTSFALTVQNDFTVANAANISNWRKGFSYYLQITQDATGGRKVTWGNLYTFPDAAAVNPNASSVTRLRLTSDGTNVRVTVANDVPAPLPVIAYDPACEFRMTRASTSDNATVSSLFSTNGGYEVAQPTSGSRPTHKRAGLTNRPGIEFGGSHRIYNNSGAAIFYPIAGNGMAVAVALKSSGTASTQNIVYSALTGWRLTYASGNLYLGSSGAGIAVPMTANAGTLKIAVLVMKAGGGGFAIDNDGVTYIGSPTFGTPTGGTAGLMIGDNDSGTEPFTGTLGAVEIWNHELSFAQAQAVFARMKALYGVI